MKKDLRLIALGIWIAIVPFLGFPGAWKTVIFVVSGLAVVLLTILWRHELLYSSSVNTGERSNGVYVENEFTAQSTSPRSSSVVSKEAPEHEKPQTHS
ncbi:hypothetical protein IID27_02900 [Patescibacteria group bacterium]|nr:hypothetical protein [Patescibacteria group bacterium]